MAMPPVNVVISDKMKLPNGAMAAGFGGEILHSRTWFADERDEFISWLRAEFAASNAIIDSLCHHLRAVGEPGEYDVLIGCVQQRRGAWSPVLHMQQYFPITEIMLALQQVAWRRQQRFTDQVKVGGKEFKRSVVHRSGSRQGQRAHNIKESVDSQKLNANASITGNVEKKGERKGREEPKFGGNDIRRSGDKGLSHEPIVTDASLKFPVDSSLTTSRNSDGTNYPCTEILLEDTKGENGLDSKGSCNLPVEKNGEAFQNQTAQDLTISPKTFNAMEINDGETVNVAEGLNLYDKLLDDAEVSKLISLVNDLRVTGKQGRFQGPTYVVSKRPYKGHGREMIQLGVAISDASHDEDPANRKVEPIPGLLQSIIDRLINMQLMPLKPDSCIIDVFNEGDHSQPHSFPHWFGKPVCLLSLNECEMVFGVAIAAERHGIYRGAFKLTLAPGSLLVMQGKSTDHAKRAIPSTCNQRILITFAISQPRKAPQGDTQHTRSQAVQASNWVPSPSRSKSSIRLKHYTPIPAAGVLQAPPIQSQLPPLNSISPLFVPAPISAVMAFPTSVPLPPASAGWPSAPRHSAPCLPVPGTGVFLPPPGSGRLSPTQEMSTVAPSYAALQGETENDAGKVNGNNNSSPEGSLDEKQQQQECNGCMDEGGSGGMAAEEDQEQNVDSEMDTKTNGTA